MVDAIVVTPPRYGNGVTYEFTIAPDDAFQGYRLKHEALVGCSTRLVHVITRMKTLLAKYLAPYGTYRLITEVSQPEVFTPNKLPRVHFHGTVQFVDVLSFLTEGAHYIQDHCTMTINPLRKEYWLQYIAKQKDLFDPLVSAGASFRDYCIDSSTQRLEMAAVTAPGKTIEECFRKASTNRRR